MKSFKSIALGFSMGLGALLTQSCLKQEVKPATSFDFKFKDSSSIQQPLLVDPVAVHYEDTLKVVNMSAITGCDSCATPEQISFTFVKKDSVTNKNILVYNIAYKTTSADKMQFTFPTEIVSADQEPVNTGSRYTATFPFTGRVVATDLVDNKQHLLLPATATDLPEGYIDYLADNKPSVVSVTRAGSSKPGNIAQVNATYNRASSIVYKNAIK